MFTPITHEAALLYVLVSLDGSSALSNLVATLGVAYITLDEFHYLMGNALSGVSCQLRDINLSVNLNSVCFSSTRTPVPRCSDDAAFHREAKSLKARYQEAVLKNISIESGIFHLLGSGYPANENILHALALCQDIKNHDLRTCWGLVISELSIIGGPAGLEELIFSLQEGMDLMRGEDWETGYRDSGIIGPRLYYERTGNVLSFGYWRDIVGQCPSQEFIDELLILLLRYERAISPTE